MSRPIARPETLSRRGRKPNNCGPSQLGSTAKGSALPQTHLTGARLEQLAGSLSVRDREVLRFVHDSRFATGHQLVRRFWRTSDQASAGARAARRVLKRLVDLRVLTTLPRRIGGIRTGSQGLIYRTGRAGVRLLAIRASADLALKCPARCTCRTRSPPPSW